jgi:hypothetical protein
MCIKSDFHRQSNELLLIKDNWRWLLTRTLCEVQVTEFNTTVSLFHSHILIIYKGEPLQLSLLQNFQVM